MSESATKAALSPGIYIDLDVAGMIFIDPKEVLKAGGVESDNLLEARIYETLRKQYIAIGHCVTLLTDEEPDNDGDT